MVMKLFMVISILARCVVSKPDGSLTTIVSKCINYKSVLPHGECRQILQFNKIHQTADEARKRNSVAVNFDVMMRSVITMGLRTSWPILMNLMNAKLYQCTKIPSLRKKVDKIEKEFRQKHLNKISRNIAGCLKSFKWIFCQISHPVCVTSNGKQYLSPLCRSICTDDKCAQLLKVLYKPWKELYDVCPNVVPDVSKYHKYLTCKSFPVEDKNHPERCQKKTFWHRDNSLSQSEPVFDELESELQTKSIFDTDGEHAFVAPDTSRFSETSEETALKAFMNNNVNDFTTKRTPLDTENGQTNGIEDKETAVIKNEEISNEASMKMSREKKKPAFSEQSMFQSQNNPLLVDKKEKALQPGCRPYSEILPNGECMGVLKHHKIYQSNKKARKVNLQLLYFQIGMDTLRNAKKEKDLDEVFALVKISLEKCKHWGTKLSRKLSELIKRVKKEFMSDLEYIVGCTDYWTWFSCHMKHPVCLTSSQKEMIFSLPCKSSCLNDGCNGTCRRILQSIFNATKDISEFCPDRVHNASRFISLVTCDAFPSADLTHLERCQMRAKWEKPSANWTKTCYQKKGMNYGGSTSVTVSGKTCKPWNINPYLKSSLYPSLEKNYCRNPQGYSDRPWCYVDENNWEFCPIQKCKTRTEKRGISKVAIALISMGVVFIIIAVAMSCYIFCLKKKLPTREQASMEDDLYYVCDIPKPREGFQVLNVPLLQENQQSEQK